VLECCVAIVILTGKWLGYLHLFLFYFHYYPVPRGKYHVIFLRSVFGCKLILHWIRLHGVVLS